jgi:RHS repeat-associated protein
VTARFPNQWYDDDVGLTYNRMRWYEPRLGMFVSPDPLLLQGNLNPRDYAPNPLMFIDPMGQTTGSPGGGAGGGCPPFVGTQPSTGGPWPNAVPPGKNFNPGTQAEPGYVDCPPSLLNATKFDEAAANAGKPGGPPAGTTVQDQVDAAGAKYGCHSCGSMSGDGPGGKPGGHFTADHQPPATSYNNGVPRGTKLPTSAQPPPGSVRLLPQCKKCYPSQGGNVGAMKKYNPADLAALKTQVMAYNNDPATKTK